MEFIDSHSHIDFNDFNDDRSKMIERASHVGVRDIIVSATTEQRWQVLKDVTQTYSQCHAAYGLHPMFLNEHRLEHLDSLKKWLDQEEAVAVGEIGLDYYIDEFTDDNGKKAQLNYFISQLEIASEFNLPVIIHSRKSLDIVLKQLRRFPNLLGSIHSFSGSEQQAKQLIELGFYLGFGGPITYTRATRLRKLIATLPLESLILETDAPDQPDAQHHGERNESAYLPLIAEVIAELRNIEIQKVAEVTTLNAKTLFKLKK